MQQPKAVIVSMEILADRQQTYAGGLGILAGDFVRSAKDLNLSIAGITLFYRHGYVRHHIEGRNIIDLPEKIDREAFEKVASIKFDLKNETRVEADVLKQKDVDCPVYYIDTTPSKDEIIQNVSERLYIENSTEERLIKELVLSIGALEAMNKLGFDPEKIHMNESHSVFIAIELFKREKNLEKIAKKLVFTTHTPLPHGHERYDYKLVEKYYDIPDYIKKISPNVLHLSRVANHFAGYTNAVSLKHSLVVRKLIPEISRADWITNGIHHVRWSTPITQKFFDAYLPDWRNEPSKLVYATTIPFREILKLRQANKVEMITFLNERGYNSKDLDESGFTVVARRRITGYKRLDMIFRNVERVEKLGRKYGLQIVISGVAHPHDMDAKNMMRHFVDLTSMLKHAKLSLYFEKGYESERIIIAGGDLLLHTPLPPYEACGTSWMRASLNAVPVLSSRDGGVIEGIIDGYNGFLFGENLMEPKNVNNYNEFMNKLEYIAQLWNSDKKMYAEIARNAIRMISWFNSYRMVKEYWRRAYGFKD